MGWWSYCNMEVPGAPPSVYGMVEIPLREEFSFIPEGFQFTWEGWGGVGGAMKGLAGCQQRSQEGRSAGAGEGQGMCVSQWGAAVGMGTVGRTVGLNNLSMRMTLEHWGKAKVVEAQLANRVSPLERDILQGNMDTLCGEFCAGFGGLNLPLPAPSPWVPSKHIWCPARALEGSLE